MKRIPLPKHLAFIVFFFFILIPFFGLSASGIEFHGLKDELLDNKQRITMEFDTQNPIYDINQLQNPFRIVVNFKDQVVAKDVTPVKKDVGYVQLVRFLCLNDEEGQKEYYLNAVIFEIREDCEFEINEKDKAIVLELFPASSSKENSLADSRIQADLVRDELKVAKKLYGNKNFYQAKAICEKVLNHDPNNRKAEKLMKKINKRLEKMNKEADSLADAVAEKKEGNWNKTEDDAMKLAGEMQKEILSKAETEAEFQEYVMNGKKYYKHKRYEEAIEIWERALHLIPDDKEIVSLIARANENIKQRRSSGAYKKVDLPEDLQMEVLKLIQKGEEEFSNLDYAHCIQTFEKVLELDSGNLKAMRYLARAKKNQREYVEEGGAKEDVIMNPMALGEDLGILSLTDCLEIGLANHLPSKVSQEEVLLAKYKVKDAKRALFPKVKIKYKQTAGTTTGDDFEGQEYGAEFQQKLYSGGKYRTLYNQARINMAVARKNYEKTKAEFAFEVTQAYYNLAFAKEKMNHKKELLKKVEELLVIAEKQFEAKALTLAEVLESRSQVDEVRYQFQQMENDLHLAQLALLQLLSITHSSALDILSIPEPIIFDLNSEELVQVGYKNRRDYQVKKLMTLFHKYGLESSIKKNSFDVELNGSYGRRDEYFVTENVDLKDEYYFGIKISKPLGPHILEMNALTQDKVPQIGQTTPTEYESGEIALKLWENKNDLSIAEENINYHKSLSELENAKRTLVHDVHSSIFSVKEAEAKIVNQKASVAFALEELRSMRAKQKVEQASIVQVMRNEVKFWNAKTDLISAQADYYISVAKLNNHLGVHDYFDPAAGVISRDKEGLTPGIRLMVQEKSDQKKWFKKILGDSYYYPDEVVTDILKEKQEKSIMKKGFLGMFNKEDQEMKEYKKYDEKFEFSLAEKKKRKWWGFGGGKLDDDFSGFYSSQKEYDQAFSLTPEGKTENQIVSGEDDMDFKSLLESKENVVFSGYEIQEYSDRTEIIFKTNLKPQYSVSPMENPFRILVNIKDVAYSNLTDYDPIEKGGVNSIKFYHTQAVLDSMYKNWRRLLSFVIELDKKTEYEIEPLDQTLKMVIKK